MARTSRWDKTEINSEVKCNYKVGVYARLSLEDSGNKTNKDTIENQVKLVKNHLAKLSSIGSIDSYIDNGFTGTNFSRPSFEKLVEDCRKGRINCIAVKDFSRFGRNHLESGNYIENVFPFLGIRFISVLDAYDSLDGKNETLIVGIKNLMSEQYAKDISTKIKSTFENRRKKGEYLGSTPPYGFIINEDRKLSIDQDLASLINRIAESLILGKSYNEVAIELNKEGILTPANYLYSKGYSTDRRHEKKFLWNPATVSKRMRKFIDVTIENGFEISDLYRKYIDLSAEKLKKYHETYGTKSIMVQEVNYLKGLVSCKVCNRKMSLKTYFNKRFYNQYYYCVACKMEHEDNKAIRTNINEIYAVLDAQLNSFLQVAVGSVNKYKKVINKRGMKDKIAKVQMCIDDLSSNLDIVKQKRLRLYKDYSDKLFDENDYKQFTKAFDDECEQIGLKISENHSQLDILKGNFINESSLMSVMKQDDFSDMDTKKLIPILVEHISISEKREVFVEMKFSDEIKKFDELASKAGEVLA